MFAKEVKLSQGEDLSLPELEGGGDLARGGESEPSSPGESSSPGWGLGEGLAGAGVPPEPEQDELGPTPSRLPPPTYSSVRVESVQAGHCIRRATLEGSVPGGDGGSG